MRLGMQSSKCSTATCTYADAVVSLVRYSEEALQKLAVIAKEEQVNEIIVESNFGDGMFNQLFLPVLSKVHAVTMSEVRHNIAEGTPHHRCP